MCMCVCVCSDEKRDRAVRDLFIHQSTRIDLIFLCQSVCLGICLCKCIYVCIHVCVCPSDRDTCQFVYSINLAASTLHKQKREIRCSTRHNQHPSSLSLLPSSILNINRLSSFQFLLPRICKRTQSNMQILSSTHPRSPSSLLLTLRNSSLI
jgi:hypothetical protein